MDSAVTRKDSVGKMLMLGVQHVFAMFGATVLVPTLTGLSPAVALFCAGVATLLFHLFTERKVPTFLGSSFAFIAAIIAAATYASGGSAFGTPDYQAALPYATGGIIFSGILYLVFALLVKLFGVERVRSFFPPIVTGPVILVIGMMLAPTAISSIVAPIPGFHLGLNWVIALITVATIFVISLFARGFLRLIPILIGIAVGYAASAAMGAVDFAAVTDTSWFTVPAFFLPKFDLHCIMLIAPISIVTFVEHVGDISASSAVVGKDFITDPGLHKTLFADGIAVMFAGLVGGPACTTYSENTGVLAATKNYNPATLRIAAVFAILMAFLGKLGAALQSMPGPVMGGVSIVLFGMIGAVGLRQLIENRVDLQNSRNMLVCAVMLVMGLGASGAVVIGGVSVSGVALSAVLGILLNKLLPERLGEQA
jgi:uracil permease